MSYTLAEIEAECQKHGQEISRLTADLAALRQRAESAERERDALSRDYVDAVGEKLAFRNRCARLERALASIASAPAFDANTQSLVDLARNTIKAIAAPDAAPADDWTVRLCDYDRLWQAALALRHACKDRLPPGHYDKLSEECRAVDEAKKAP